MGRIDRNAPHRRAVSQSAAPSRGQRKRAAKRASLVTKKALLTAKKIGLTERVAPEIPKAEDVLALTATDNTPAAQPCPEDSGSAFQRVISNRGKRMLMSAEMRQLHAVLNASAFQADPLAAINAHLREAAYPNPVQPVNAEPKNGACTEKNQHVRGGREDKRPSAKKHFKGRNAKMRIKK